ncbi:MAG: translocation/assembly module TamB [Bacteroidetes bacterium QH_2_64_26]|nr:MAG: translocation/assembly module TamB [Bacteroidetes bacterium QH_2_64_26]
MAPPSDPPDPDPAAPAPDDSSRRRRWGRRVLWGLGGLIGTVLGGLVLFLLVLQTETGATAAVQALAPYVNPLPGTTLSVERASGNWVRDVRLTNVSLTRPDSTADMPVTMARVDTLAVQYRPSALLWGRLHLVSVSVHGPSITMRQAPDSTWDWERLYPSPEPAPDDTSASMPIQVDQLRVDGGAFNAAFFAEERDSTASIRGLEARAQDLQFGDAVGGRLDTLGLRGALPADTTTLQLSTRGTLSSSRLRIDTLRLSSPRSQVHGHGGARLPLGPHDTLDDVDLSLRTAPLVLGDLTTFVPGVRVDPSETITLDARLTGSGRRLSLTTEARVRNGGTLSAQVDATPRLETASDTAALRYRIEAQADRLTTSLLGPPDSTQNVLTGTVAGTLDGPALDTLSGTVRAELTETRLYGIDASAVTLASTLEEGTATVDLTGTLDGTTLSVSGTTRPLDAAPSATLSAQVDALSLAAVAPDAGIDGRISGTAQVDARSMGTETATYEVEATVTDSRIGAQPIESGRFSLVLNSEEAVVDGRFQFPTGRLVTAGSAALDGSEQFALDQGRLENVNLAALVGDTTASRLSGTVQVQGQGFTPATLEGRTTIRVSDAYYGPHRMSSLDTEARLDDGRLTADASARLNGSDWTLSVTGRPFAERPSVELTQGRFRDVDIGPFLQDTTQSSALHGTIRGRVQGTTPDALRLSANLTLESSQINRQQISGASLSATMRAGTLRSNLDLETPEGAIRLAVEAQPFADTPQYRVANGTFRNVDVGALAQVPGLTTDLSGSAALTVQGADLSDLSVESELTVQASTINRAAVPDGRLTVTPNQGRLEATGQFSVAGGSFQLNGHVDSLAATPTYALRTTARSVDVGALAGLDSLDANVHEARWTMEGRGTSLNGLMASTRLSVDSVQLDRTRIHALNLAAAIDDGRLQVHTLSGRSNVGRIEGGGLLGLTPQAGASKFDLQATVTNAQPLRRLVGASTLDLEKGVLDAHVYGAAGAQRFDGTVELNGFIYNDLRLSAVSGSFNGKRGASQLLERVEVEADAGYLSVPSLTANQTQLQALYDGTTVDLSTSVELDETHTTSLEASFRPPLDSLTLHLHDITARMGPDRWTLADETTLTLGTAYQVDNLRLESDTQYVEAGGIIDPDGSQDFRVDLNNVRLDGVAPLIGLSGLGGRATGQLDLTGPATAPTFDGSLDLDLRSEEDKVGTLRLVVDYEDLAMTLDARLTHRDGSVLTVAGSVPADLRLQASSSAPAPDRPVRLDASTDRFPINWIDPFLDPSTLRSVTGTLTADAEVRGTFDQPVLSGTISVADLGGSVPTLNTNYRDGSARLELEGNTLRLADSQIRSPNGGSARVTGSINFPQLTVGEYDLSIDASNFLAIDTPAYRKAVIDGTATLRGTIQRPALSGNVRIQRGDVHYGEVLAETKGAMSTVSLDAQDQLTLEERFGVRISSADTTTLNTYDAMSLDLDVEITNDTWLRSKSSPTMNLQFTGDLDIQKSRKQDPRVFGTIDVVGERSTLRQFGQEFQITEGNLTFNGDPVAPYLDLTAVYDQEARGTQSSEVRITLSLSGRPDELSPTLSSEPPMTTRNILSYLATGRPADALLSGDSEGGNLATQVALGQATDFVENLAASKLGLDVVRLQVRPEGSSYLTVGRYLTPQFFASIEQPVLTSSAQSSAQSTALVPDVTIEYQFSDYLLLRSRSNQQSLQLNLLFEYAY